MVVVVFRARRTPEGQGKEYKRWFLRMSELARKMPGYISIRATWLTMASGSRCLNGSQPDTLRAWATHPEHLPVKKLGRQKFYTEYHLQVCELVRESKFRHDPKPDQGRSVG